MKKISIIVLLGSILLISGCDTLRTGFDPNQTIKLVPIMSYPELPDIEPVSPISILSWEGEFPRDMTTKIIKDTLECSLKNEGETEEQFGERCVEYPIIRNSNVFIGFNQANWNIIIENFAKLRGQLFEYKKRIEEINNQRKEWREKAKAERQRVEELQVD